MSNPSNPTLQHLGRAIRQARGRLTQGELADLVGTTQTTIARWEAGGTDLGVQQVRALEAALRLPPGRLLIDAGYVRSVRMRTRTMLMNDEMLPPHTREHLVAIYDALAKLAETIDPTTP